MSLIARLFRSDSRPQASLLAAGTTLTGSLKGTGRLIIEGHLQGDASSTEVVVAPGGSINGEISADLVHVAGRVSGAVQAGRLAIVGGGSFTGNALYESLEVAEGAAFEARCRPIPATVPVPAAAPMRRPVKAPTPHLRPGKAALVAS